MSTAFEYIEIVGISSLSVEDAIKNAIAAAKVKHNISWFEVHSTRGRVTQEGAIEFQVTVKFGCK